MVEREIAQNERRKARIEDETESPLGDSGEMDDQVTTFAKPLSNERPTAEDIRRQREENDKAQRS